jgi:ABC-type multidrug transport system fused ATPase/permease subunit
MDRYEEILNTDIKIIEKSNPVSISELTSGISYKNISFAYKTEKVLDGVSFELPKNKKVALVGSSGSGKSTLADLLPRFYDVAEGAIEIDGRDIRDYKIDDLRSLMGIVTQEAILFNDSISNNILFGQTGHTMQEIEEAAKLANAYEFIMATEHGFDTVIGERGSKLSGGQRQRLAIARALLRNPPILILDEATSALDNESEKLVQQALDHLRQGRTTLVIAHRLSTIQDADEIIVMDKGRIVERGHHQLPHFAFRQRVARAGADDFNNHAFIEHQAFAGFSLIRNQTEVSGGVALIASNAVPCQPITQARRKRFARHQRFGDAGQLNAHLGSFFDNDF